jgi:hypothetical protein
MSSDAMTAGWSAPRPAQITKGAFGLPAAVTAQLRHHRLFPPIRRSAGEATRWRAVRSASASET